MLFNELFVCFQGVEEMKRQMDRWFPEVLLIATTSVGSSIGQYGPEQYMSPEELTKAYLAIRGLTEEGLAARMM